MVKWQEKLHTHTNVSMSQLNGGRLTFACRRRLKEWQRIGQSESN